MFNLFIWISKPTLNNKAKKMDKNGMLFLDKGLILLLVLQVSIIKSQPSSQNIEHGPNTDKNMRINCFLEAESPFENLTRFACEKRNCIYDPDTTNQIVPKCYFDAENLGYQLQNKISDLEYDLVLGSKAKAPFPGQISNIKLKLEYLGTNIMRVQVETVSGFTLIYLQIINTKIPR
jgi:hypothetical protein